MTHEEKLAAVAAQYQATMRRLHDERESPPSPFTRFMRHLFGNRWSLADVCCLVGCTVATAKGLSPILAMLGAWVGFAICIIIAKLGDYE